MENKMNEFEQLVFEMRRAQINFLKSRSVKYLTLSKQLEKKVDESLIAKSKC